MGFGSKFKNIVHSVTAPVSNVVQKVADPVKTAFEPATQLVTKVTAPVTNQLSIGTSLISDRTNKITGITIPAAFVSSSGKQSGPGASPPIIAPGRTGSNTTPGREDYPTPPPPKEPVIITDPVDRGGSNNGAGTFVNFLSEYGAPKAQNSPAFLAPLPAPDVPATPQEARPMASTMPSTLIMVAIGAAVLVGAFFVIRKI